MSCKQIDETTWIDDYNHVLVNVHGDSQCLNHYCTIHNHSKHVMVDFPQRWRTDRGLMERICPHGIGHTDPDEIVVDKTHGCDGCCAEPKNKYEEGYETIEIDTYTMSDVHRIIVEGFAKDGEFRARASLIRLLEEDVKQHLAEGGEDPNIDWVDGVRYAIQTIREANLYEE